MNPYFEQKILGADAVELIRLLYQHAITCVRQAREHLAARRIAERGRAINKAYRVLAELQASLQVDAAPELAKRLRGLYIYMQGRLVEANCRQADEPLAEVLGLLSTLAEAWNQIPHGGGAHNQPHELSPEHMAISSSQTGQVAVSA